MRQLNIHVPLRCNILPNDVWTFWPKVIGSNHTVTQNSDKFDESVTESDELLTTVSSMNQTKTSTMVTISNTHTPHSQAALLMRDSSIHLQACRYDIIRLIMEQLIMTYSTDELD